MRNHDFDIGVITSESKNPDFKDLVSQVIMKDRLVFVTKPDTPFDEVDLKEIPSLPLILRNHDAPLSKILQRKLKKYKLDTRDLNIKIKSNSTESIKSSIIITGGFAFLPSVIVESEIQAGLLKEVHIQHFNPSFYYLFIHRKNYKLSNQEARLKSYLLNRFK